MLKGYGQDHLKGIIQTITSIGVSHGIGITYNGMFASKYLNFEDISHLGSSSMRLLIKHFKNLKNIYVYGYSLKKSEILAVTDHPALFLICSITDKSEISYHNLII